MYAINLVDPSKEKLAVNDAKCFVEKFNTSPAELYVLRKL